MIRMKHIADFPVEYLLGNGSASLQAKPLPPFAPKVIAFLADWSRKLLVHPEIRAYPDVAGFAYWCRPANLARIKRQIAPQERRLGRGTAFHIAPANVPVNFAFSYVFGLLAGNANIVRVPESLPAQAGVLCSVAKEVLAWSEHATISSMTQMVRYSRNDTITQYFSARADVRLIWGGDATIRHLRSMPAAPRCVDISFADRYSLCLLGAETILTSDESELELLAAGFYNDVFLLDQNACSSPHLILWQGSEDAVLAAQDRFWKAVDDVLRMKPMPDGIHVVDKYTHLCRVAMQINGVIAHPLGNHSVYRVRVTEIPENIADFRGRHGFFFESIDNDLSQLRRIVNEQYQTLTYFGVDADMLVDEIIEAGLLGIDRVVPVGKALDIGVIWDGYDLVRTMSRIIAIQ